MPQDREEDGAESSRKWVADEVLQPILLQMEEKMFEVRRTVASFELGESDYPEHLQGYTILFPIVMPPISMEIPAGAAQAPS